ncbi:MAG: beta-propeller fold lactonase family protein [Firmicutes bacterium]|nr:beta-propeller fold lactonase family protein [Bacillota bacterium]
MKNRILTFSSALVIALLIVVNTAFAQFNYGNGYDQQSGSIFGMVIGPTKGNTTKVRHLPIEGAAVEALGPKGPYKTMTGPHGNFSFLSIPSGEYTITIMKEGYETYTRQAVIEPMGMLNLDYISLLPDGKTPKQFDLIAAKSIFVTFAGIRVKSADTEASAPIRSKIMESGEVFKNDGKDGNQGLTPASGDSAAPAAPGPGGMAFENSLMAINPQNTNQIDYIRMAGNPTWLCFSKDGSKVYVADRKNHISVYSAKQNYVKTANIPISSPATDITASPEENRIYVANAEGITVIDSTGDTPDDNIELPPMSDGSRGIPKALVCSEDGSMLYIAVSYETSGEVLVLHTASKKVTARIKVGADPSGIALSPDGSKIFTANNGSSTVSVLQARPLSLICSVVVGTGPVKIAVAPNGKKVFVTNRNNDSLSILSGAMFDNMETVKVGREPLGVAVSEDGSTVYTANSADGTVSIIDVKTCSEIRRIAPHPLSRPYGIAIKP